MLPCSGGEVRPKISEWHHSGVSLQGTRVGINGMTIGLHIAFYLEMPYWLELTGLVSPQQWLAFNQCLNYSATLGLQ